MLEPGTYIDSHWGHYQSQRVIELARELGWEPEDAEEVDRLTRNYELNGGVDEYEVWYEMADEATNYINDNHTPDDHWFGYHADIGDVGVWPIDEDDL